MMMEEHGSKRFNAINVSKILAEICAGLRCCSLKYHSSSRSSSPSSLVTQIGMISFPF